MSWNIKLIGCRCGVRTAVEKDTTLPEPIKQAILSVLGKELGAPHGVRVEGSGHTYTGEGSYRSNIYKLEVEPFDMVDHPAEDVPGPAS